jgi:hypothetical protein
VDGPLVASLTQPLAGEPLDADQAPHLRPPANDNGVWIRGWSVPGRNHSCLRRRYTPTVFDTAGWATRFQAVTYDGLPGYQTSLDYAIMCAGAGAPCSCSYQDSWVAPEAAAAANAVWEETVVAAAQVSAPKRLPPPAGLCLQWDAARGQCGKYGPEARCVECEDAVGAPIPV